MTVNQIQADIRRMKRFICERVPEDGRIVLADGDEGPAWADLLPVWDEDGDCDLHIETNEPEFVNLREVYDHFRRREMTWAEWSRLYLPRFLGDVALLKQRRDKESSDDQNQSNLLRLAQCVRVSGHSESTLRRAIRDCRLKAHTIGRGRKRPTYGIIRSDLEAYIEASRVQLPDSPSIPIIGVRKKSRHFA